MPIECDRFRTYPGKTGALAEILIHKPPQEVADCVAEPANAPSWYANIESVEWETGPPLAVGSRIAFVAHFLGRRLSYTYEVVEYRRGERLVMRTERRCPHAPQSRRAVGVLSDRPPPVRTSACSPPSPGTRSCHGVATYTLIEELSG
jgi:hypothetical protein